MYQLYYYPSNANLAPHMLLEELGVDYELVLVDRDRDAHKSPEYLKLNPTGRIPVLVDGDFVLYETAAICLHLVDRHSRNGLAPPVGTAARAEFYQWLIYLTNTLQAELITYYYPERLANDDTGAEMVKRHAEARVGTMLDLIEAKLADNVSSKRGAYLLGENYTAVDPYLLMLARWTRNFAHPARARRYLGQYLDQIASRPAVQRAFAAEGIVAPLF
ncbi:MAG TPA: glutathione S-transferase family protein [Burkholderiaceae bacterium]|nr:glutathione S-transferase family protein [Burkholderiaceae bacterium]